MAARCLGDHFLLVKNEQDAEDNAANSWMQRWPTTTEIDFVGQSFHTKVAIQPATVEHEKAQSMPSNLP